MKFVQNLSIGLKLALSFVLLFCIILFVGFAWRQGIMSFTNMEKQTSELINLKAELRQLQIVHYRWVDSLSDAALKKDKFNGQLDHALCGFGKWYYSYHLPFPELEANFEALAEPHKKLHEAGAAAVKAIEQGDGEAAERHALQARQALLPELMKEYDPFVEGIGAVHDRLEAELMRSITKQERLSIAILSVSLIMVIGFAVTLTRMISLPLKKIMGTAAAISKGDLSQEELTFCDRNDEIGQLCVMFNNMLTELRKLVAQAELIANGIIGADEVEAKMAGGMDIETAAAGDGAARGDLADAFSRMQAQLRKLTVQARKIAAGDLNNAALEVKISGELGGAFSHMTATLKEMAVVAGQIAAGDLSVKMNDGASGVLADSFRKMTRNLRGLIEQVKEQTNLLAGSSATLAQVSEQSTQTITQLSSTVMQISSATTSVAQSSQSASNTAHDADSSSRKGKELMAKLVDRIRVVASMAETSESAMDGLSRRSAQIGDIVNVITKIADQTNLLSLNAAIEAARAGEAGRGFAVVADEVRKLAESSASSAQEIAKIITEVQAETTTAAVSVRNGQKEIQEGALLTEDASKRFGEIVTQVENIARQIEQIAAASEETAASAEESSASSQEQTAAIEEISALSTQLADTAKALQKAVGQFQL